MSRPPRSRPHPALLRARYRTLFFLCVTALVLALGEPVAVGPALAGALFGLYSVGVARSRPCELAHTFVVLDWVCLGIAVALSGGGASWLLATLPFLAFGQVARAPRGEWPFMIGPSLLLPIILGIADPTLDGSRIGTFAKVVVLVAGGCIAATRLHRRPASHHRRGHHALKVDPGTGLSTGACLPTFLEDAAETAAAEHAPLSVVYLRLEHYADSRDFLGDAASEELVRGVARRVERRAGPDGRAFRVRPDAIVLALPGLSLAEARETAADLSHEVSRNLIAGRRQTLTTGVASFPALRSMEDVLVAARAEAMPPAASVAHADAAVPPTTAPWPARLRRAAG